MNNIYKAEIHPICKGYSITVFRNFRISIALGHYTNKTYDYWKSLDGRKRTLSTKHFWAALITKGV